MPFRQAPLSLTRNLAGMRPYQCEGIRWLTTRHRCALLADAMRVGKTAQTLRAMPTRVAGIVVCPAIVMLVWVAECKKWRPDLNVMIVHDLTRAPRAGELLIISWDALPEPIPGWKKLTPLSLSHVLLVEDEAHYAQNPEALRTIKVRLLGAQCQTVWGLTGTPLTGTMANLFGVLESCRIVAAEVAERLSPESLKELLSRVMLRRTLADVVDDLPAKTYQNVPVPCPADLSEWLDELDERWAEIGHGDLPPFEMMSEARMALARSRIAPAIAFARELLNDNTGPLVVFSVHKEPGLAMADEIFGAACINGETSREERESLMQAFQAGELNLLALTMQAGGVGIDLSAANSILEVDLDWTPGVNAQAEARPEKVGKKEPLHIYRMVTDHPLDLRVLEILADKQARQEELGL